jgi:hypothetical protein
MSNTVNIVNVLGWIQEARIENEAVITPALKELRDQLLQDPPPTGDQRWHVLRAAIESREAQIAGYEAELSSLRLWSMLLKALIWDAQGDTEGFDEEISYAVGFVTDTNATASLDGTFRWAVEELTKALNQRAYRP